MVIRKEELITGEIYHVFNKSIAGYKIFNSDAEYSRGMKAIRYYQRDRPSIRLSRYIEIIETKGQDSDEELEWCNLDKIVQIYAYCIMPTHIHLVVKQLKENGISKFMGNTLNSYARYFNTKYKRKGPLWEGPFKNVPVITDEEFLHLTRYVHLNPATAYLVEKPEEWPVSSYKEYVLDMDDAERICEYQDVLDIQPHSYREFVEDRISYQRDLALISKLVLE